MSDEVPEWQTVFGARVKSPFDCTDGVLMDAISISKSAFEKYSDFDRDGEQPDCKLLFDMII